MSDDYDPTDIKHLADLKPGRERARDHIVLPTRLWVVSDLHVNHAPWSPDYVPDHDIMIVAGDVHDSPIEVMLQLHAMARWRSVPVIFVPGNHDVFGADLDFWDARHERLAEAGVHVLSSGQEVVIGSVRFVGATLWTDWLINELEFQSQRWAARHMPEYNYVTRPDGELIWPIDLSNEHDRHRGAIEHVLGQRHEGPSVVVTHHAPSPKSLRPGEIRSVEAAAYASDLEQVMLEFGPDLWVHGHTHHAVDYGVGHTRVVSNPRGYQGDDWAEDSGWVQDLVIEV